MKGVPYIDTLESEQTFRFLCSFQFLTFKTLSAGNASFSDCFIEVLKISNNEHYQTHFHAPNLKLRSPLFFFISLVILKFLMKSQKAENFGNVTLSQIDEKKFHRLAAMNFLTENLEVLSQKL